MSTIGQWTPSSSNGPEERNMSRRTQAATVGVLLGGSSSERDVSLNTGLACADALRGAGYPVVEVDWSPAHPTALLDAGVEVAFLALHGGYGEGGSIQGLLNCLGIPYTGSGVLASALAMDKVRSKRLFDALGLSTPAYRVLTADESRALGQAELAEPVLPLPCVVKPSCEGSSVGITIVRDQAQLPAAFTTALHNDDDVLVEAFIEGRELSVGIFDDQVLGAVEIAPAEGFYDYHAKYLAADTQYRVPAPLAAPVRDAVEGLAAAAYRAIGCRGVARVDIMLDAAEQPWLLEVNTLPGMTATSLVPKLAEARGESFQSLVSRMVGAARTDGE